MRFFVFIVSIFCFLAGTALRADQPQPTKSERPVIQVFEAKVDRKPEGNSFVLVGESKLKFKSASFVPERETAGKYSVDVTIDEFPSEVGRSLVLLVKDKYFVPEGWGGSKGVYWSLSLRNVDKEYTEILVGGALAEAPKGSFLIQYNPWSKAYAVGAPVKFELAFKNTGAVPLSVYYATKGGGNYPCRDMQLKFTATLNGQPVSPNPKPLPDGFLSQPFESKPNTWLRRTENLADWLQLDKPGKYVVDAYYRLDIQNPTKGASPWLWPVTYHNQFSIQIGE